MSKPCRTCDSLKLVRAAVAQVGVGVEGVLLLELVGLRQELLAGSEGSIYLLLREAMICSTRICKGGQGVITSSLMR